jgi:hypothetical protein
MSVLRRKIKKQSVKLRLNEPQGHQVCGEPTIPGTRRLLQFIQGLVQAAHKIWSDSIREAGGLTAEDSLTECVMEEGVLHIELMKRPVAGGSNGEHRAHGGRFDNWAESLIVVYTRVLREPPEDPRERLVGENPFASDDIGATRPGNKFLGPIAQKGPVLFLHCCTPIRLGKRDTDRGRD